MSKRRYVTAELGYCVVKLVVEEGEATSLTIMAPADTNADRYAPAESVEVFERVNIQKLQKFLNANLAEGAGNEKETSTRVDGGEVPDLTGAEDRG